MLQGLGCSGILSPTSQTPIPWLPKSVLGGLGGLHPNMSAMESWQDCIEGNVSRMYGLGCQLVTHSDPLLMWKELAGERFGSNSGLLLGLL